MSILNFFLKGKLVSEKISFILQKISECTDIEKLEIVIFIDSYGGSLSVSLAFANFICENKLDLTTVNVGACDSAAIPLFVAGCKRYCSANGQFRFHEIRREVNDLLTKNELAALIREIDMTENSVATFLRERTGLAPAQCKRNMHSNRIWNKTQAEKNNFLTSTAEKNLENHKTFFLLDDIWLQNNVTR